MEIKQRIYCYSVGTFAIALGAAVTSIKENGIPLLLLGLAIMVVTALSARRFADASNEPAILAGDMAPERAVAMADKAADR